MAVYNVILQTPDEPLTEEWSWLTDLQRAWDGNETTDPLRRYPKRVFTGKFSFSDVADLRRHLALSFRSYKTLFYFPLFQYMVKLKAKATAGDLFVTVNVLRSDFREGQQAVIIENGTYEVLTIDTLALDTVTFTTGLVNSYSARAIVCPLSRVYTQPTNTASRKNPDDSGEAGFKFQEYEPMAPFVSPLNTQTLTTFDSLPVLDLLAFGDSFEQSLETGLQIEEFIGLPALLSPWDQSKVTFPLRFLCNRILDNDSWLMWSVFADECQGSNGIFLFPSNRADLAVVTPAVGGGALVTVAGHEYVDHYWGLDTFKRIVIESDAGVHYAKVTGVTDVSGNDRLTFTPALPAGTGWNLNQKISFLLKVRNSNDKITCDHYGFHTEVSLSVRTVN